MSIQTETISVNRYAPEGSEAVNLYSTGLDGGSMLTIGQLSIAVSMRAAAVYETQSVLKMNKMAIGSDLLSTASECLEHIANGTGDWESMKTFMRDRLGIAVSLPDAIDTYAKRMQAIDALKPKVDALSQSQQTDMIDLQTLINRRDTAFASSSNIVRAFGTSQNGTAQNLV